MPKKSPKDDFTFEDAVTELEEIVTSMEEEQLPLKELIDKYERGAKLQKQCETFLTSAKKRLETVAKDSANTPSENTTQPPSNDDDEIRLF